MVLILLGAPGSGKGTQAKVLKDKLQVPHLSTGDMLRSAVASGNALGIQAKSFMDKGQLVPDSLVLDLLKERIELSDCAKGFILDGYPRNISQANSLEKVLTDANKIINNVIAIKVNDSDLIKRLTGRRTCKKCGTGFHVLFQPPKKEGICDSCGGELIQRQDDNEKVISERLIVYNQQTAPLLEYYNKKQILKTIDGNLNPEKVSSEILRTIGFTK